MAQHKDSIRAYRITWRGLAIEDAQHAYTDTITSAMALADGLETLQRTKAHPVVQDVCLYAWDSQARGYTLVRG